MTATPVLTSTPTIEPTPYPAMPGDIFEIAESIKLVDYAVSGIKLRDRSTVRSLLGRSLKKERWYDGEGSFFFNKTDDQLLSLYSNPGDIPGIFREYRVSWRFREDDRHIPVWKGKKEFVTHRGIMVKMTRTEVVKLLGPPQSIEKVVDRPDPQMFVHIYHHTIHDPKSSMVYYYSARYTYTKDVLVEFDVSIIPQEKDTLGL